MPEEPPVFLPGSSSTNESDTEIGEGSIKGGVIQQSSPENEICLTKGCVKAAHQLNEAIDETADPCSSFYQFACGGFNQKAVIPDHQTSQGSGSMLRSMVNERLRKLFEADNKATESKVYESVRNLYKSCMDIDSSEETGLKE